MVVLFCVAIIHSLHTSMKAGLIYIKRMSKKQKCLSNTESWCWAAVISIQVNTNVTWDMTLFSICNTYCIHKLRLYISINIEMSHLHAVYVLLIGHFKQSWNNMNYPVQSINMEINISVFMLGLQANVHRLPDAVLLLFTRSPSQYFWNIDRISLVI